MLLDATSRTTSTGTEMDGRGLRSPFSAPANGCRFAPRCDRADEDCLSRQPELHQIDDYRWVRCERTATPGR
jgi:oligopeptide/dipeptide ABC transporter ATP-binding protein